MRRAQKEVRRIDGRGGATIVLLGFVGAWAMVRRAEYPQACPFVITKQEWERASLEGGEQ